VYADNGKLEITVVCPEDDNDPLSLFILNVQNNSITELDQIELPNSTNNYTREWICAYNLTADTSDEIVLSYSWSESSTRYSGIWIYDHDERTSTSGFTDKHSWVEDTFNPGIQSIGRLTGSVEQIALSRRLSESGVGGNIPVYIIQSDDLSDTEDCSPPDNKSNFILCSLITDWDNLDSGLDRIIAPAENQCMVWEDNGDIDAYWGETYGIAGVNKYPPFPALANLVEDTGYEYPELIVGTRTGWVNALDRTSASVESLGFPYQLPAEICGGFVVADIDLDEKLEVVFGTMDNFLHVWELDDCIEGYAPWLQCQRDATRPGTLMEE
jgi:hypothetical protein